jgi:hypothetical protein
MLPLRLNSQPLLVPRKYRLTPSVEEPAAKHRFLEPYLTNCLWTCVDPLITSKSHGQSKVDDTAPHPKQQDIYTCSHLVGNGLLCGCTDMTSGPANTCSLKYCRSASCEWTSNKSHHAGKLEPAVEETAPNPQHLPPQFLSAQIKSTSTEISHILARVPLSMLDGSPKDAW